MGSPYGISQIFLCTVLNQKTHCLKVAIASCLVQGGHVSFRQETNSPNVAIASCHVQGGERWLFRLWIYLCACLQQQPHGLNMSVLCCLDQRYHAPTCVRTSGALEQRLKSICIVSSCCRHHLHVFCDIWWAKFKTTSWSLTGAEAKTSSSEISAASPSRKSLCLNLVAPS